MLDTVMLGESKKYESPYSVHPLPVPGKVKGAPVAFIIGDPKDSRGHALYKTASVKTMGITPRKFPKVKPLGDSAWLDLAVSTDENRPVLCIPHGNYAADGFKMFHICGRDSVVCDCKHCKEFRKKKGTNYEIGCTPDFTQILNQKLRDNWKVKITLSRDELLRACNQADAISKNPDGKQTASGIIILQPSANGLGYSAENEKTGKIAGIIPCSFASSTAYDLRIAFNFEFLRAALLGMSEHITLQFSSATMPGYITDYAREAVIMPMHIS